MSFKENLKSELSYSGLLVKELAEKSGVKKHSIDNYLNKRGQQPSVEAAVRIAQALGVSVEYLVTGKEEHSAGKSFQNVEIRTVVRYFNQLTDKKRGFLLNFIKLLAEDKSL